MNVDDPRRAEAVLDGELALAEQLVRTLEAERAALTGTSPDTVAEAAAAKLELLTRLEQLEQSRRELCQGSDMTLSEGLASRWRSLMQLMARCRSANEVNGYIINVRRNQVQQLIDVVRGTNSFTYGPTGRAASTSLRGLARA